MTTVVDCEKDRTAAEMYNGRPLDLDEAGEQNGYVLDARFYKTDGSQLKTRHGQVLIPQPSDDPEDPLNWPQYKKDTMLAVIGLISMLSDYSSATGIPALIPQSIQWHTSPAIVQRSLAGNIFMLGAGGVIIVTLCSYIGRLPTVFGCQLAAIGFGIWCATATSLESYTAARILDGLFTTVGAACCLMWVKDIYFFHEQVRKINHWSLAVIASPYLGPLVASFILSRVSWPWTFWVVTMLRGVALILTVVFLDETYYNRRLAEPRPYRTSRWLRFIGVEQWKNRKTRGTFVQCISRPVIAFSKIPMALIVLYYFCNFAWVIGVNTTCTIWLTNLYGFDDTALGLFYLAGLVGPFAGWLLGHWLHDLVGKLYMRRHAGHLEPEARLAVTHLGTALMAISLIILGFALERHWHYMVIAVFFAMQIAGIMISTVCVEAYLFDAYPGGAGEITALINVGRAWGGFMAAYIQIEWVTAAGNEKAFGIQAAISVASTLIIIFLQVYGKKVRHWQGPMKFET